MAGAIVTLLREGLKVRHRSDVGCRNVGVVLADPSDDEFLEVRWATGIEESIHASQVYWMPEPDEEKQIVVICREVCVYQYVANVPASLVDGDYDTSDVHEWLDRNQGWDESELREISDRTIEQVKVIALRGDNL